MEPVFRRDHVLQVLWELLRKAVFRVGDVHRGRWVNSVNRWIMAASKDGGRAVPQRHIPGVKKAEYLARPMITHG